MDLLFCAGPLATYDEDLQAYPGLYFLHGLAETDKSLNLMAEVRVFADSFDVQIMHLKRDGTTQMAIRPPIKTFPASSVRDAVEKLHRLFHDVEDNMASAKERAASLIDEVIDHEGVRYHTGRSGEIQTMLTHSRKWDYLLND